MVLVPEEVSEAIATGRNVELMDRAHHGCTLEAFVEMVVACGKFARFCCVRGLRVSICH